MWERIELLMKERGLRIADVARGSGVSYSTLTDWKAGRYTPKNDKIVKIANFFEVSPNYIMGTSDDPDYRPNRITIDVSKISDIIATQYIKDHPEEFAEDGSNYFRIPEGKTEKDIIEALEFYTKYLSASRRDRQTVDFVLRLPQREP